MQGSPGLVAGLLALSLSACVAGPDFQPPEPPKIGAFAPPLSGPAPAASSDAQQTVQGMDIPPRWWTLFGSTALDALVDQALVNSPDVAAAEAALRQARELLYVQRAAYLPAVNASFQPLRSRNSATIAPPLADNSSIYSLYTAQLAVAYAPDVFGGTRRAVEAAAARLDAQKFQTEAAYLSLTGNLVQAALQESSLREQIAATHEIVAAETRLLELMRRQHEAGQASGADEASQETALAQAEQSLPSLEKQLAQQRDLMAMLGGRYAADGPAGTVEISALALPLEVPVGLPSGLVERRPDIRAAQANLQAASAQVGVAAAARLPSFTLTANGGSAASTLAGLTSSPNLFWTLAGGLAQPVFDAGALRHQQRAAEAAYVQAREQYRSTVLQAFQNVADALQALRIDDEALGAAVLAERAAARSLQIARKQLELGEAGAVSVLNAEQAYHQAHIALIQARTGRYADTVALFQALGAGGWPAADGRHPPA